MKKLNVLLVCGSGASSGFMAANMRKAASKQGLEIDIKARSESEIENYIDEIDALMVGPHLAYILDDIDEYTDLIWNSLNEENKVSLFVRYIDIETGKYETRIVNKNKK